MTGRRSVLQSLICLLGWRQGLCEGGLYPDRLWALLPAQRRIHHEAGTAAASGPSRSRALSKAQPCVYVLRGFVKCAKGRFFFFFTFFVVVVLKKAFKLYELQAHSSLDLPPNLAGWSLVPGCWCLIAACPQKDLIPPCGPDHQLKPSLLKEDFQGILGASSGPGQACSSCLLYK